MPNLSCLRPVLIFSCVPASTSGLIRSATGAVRPMVGASSPIRSSSCADSTLNWRMPVAEREADLVVGLGDPGIDDPLRRHAGRQRPGDLAARDGVRTQPRSREQPDHGEIAVGLDRVAEQHALAAERVLERGGPRAHRPRRIDVAWRADRRGEPAQRHLVGVQRAALVSERAQPAGAWVAARRRRLRVRRRRHQIDDLALAPTGGETAQRARPARAFGRTGAAVGGGWASASCWDAT